MNRESIEATTVKSGLSKKLGVKPAPMLARETKKNVLKEASRVRKETIEWGTKQPWAQRVMKNVQYASDRGEYSTSMSFDSEEEALRAKDLFSRLGYKTSINRTISLDYVDFMLNPLNKGKTDEDYGGPASYSELYVSWE